MTIRWHGHRFTLGGCANGNEPSAPLYRNIGFGACEYSGGRFIALRPPYASLTNRKFMGLRREFILATNSFIQERVLQLRNIDIFKCRLGWRAEGVKWQLKTHRGVLPIPNGRQDQAKLLRQPIWLFQNLASNRTHFLSIARKFGCLLLVGQSTQVFATFGSHRRQLKHSKTRSKRFHGLLTIIITSPRRDSPYNIGLSLQTRPNLCMQAESYDTGADKLVPKKVNSTLEPGWSQSIG